MFKRILLPIDVDQESSWRRSLPIAERMATDYGAELHVMSVVPSFGMAMVGSYFPPDFEKKALAEASRHLRELVDAHADKPDAITIHVAHGTIYEEVIRAAQKLGCDLIVMSSHRPELRIGARQKGRARIGARHQRSCANRRAPRKVVRE